MGAWDRTWALVQWVGWGVAALGLMVFAWAMWWDRVRGRRGRRRCPRCWYDMAAVVGLVCPECGKRVRRERALGRTRRRRWSAAAGFTLAAAGVLAGTIEPEPLIRAVPVSTWVRVMPRLDPAAAAEVTTKGLGDPALPDSAFARVRAVYRAGVALDLCRTGTTVTAPAGTPIVMIQSGGILAAPGDPRIARRTQGPGQLRTGATPAVNVALRTIVQAPDLSPLAMPAVHRLVVNPGETAEDREQCLMVIETLEGKDAAWKAVEGIMASSGDEAFQQYVLERFTYWLDTDERGMKLFLLAVENADGEALRYAADVLGRSGERGLVAIDPLRRASLRAKDRIAQMATTAALDRLQRLRQRR